MNKWLKQNITIMVVITLLGGYGVGAAVAGVMKSDIDRLKQQVDGLPERLGKLEQKTDDIKESVYRIEGYMKK